MTTTLIFICIGLAILAGLFGYRLRVLREDYDHLLEQASKDHASNRTELAVCKTNYAIIKEANERMKAERAKLYFRNEKGQIQAISKKAGK
jgi:hypothetical protein